MNGIDGQEHGSNERKTSNMFREELTELVNLYLAKLDDPNRVIAMLGTEFVNSMLDQGVDVSDTLDLVLDELDFRTKPEKLKPSKPILRLVKNT